VIEKNITIKNYLGQILGYIEERNGKKITYNFLRQFLAHMKRTAASQKTSMEGFYIEETLYWI